MYGWKSAPDCPVRDAFKRQKDDVMKEFETRSSQVFLQLNEQVRRCVKTCVSKHAIISCTQGFSMFVF